jgi:hypothetical protein
MITITMLLARMIAFPNQGLMGSRPSHVYRPPNTEFSSEARAILTPAPS